MYQVKNQNSQTCLYNDRPRETQKVVFVDRWSLEQVWLYYIYCILQLLYCNWQSLQIALKKLTTYDAQWIRKLCNWKWFLFVFCFEIHKCILKSNPRESTKLFWYLQKTCNLKPYFLCLFIIQVCTYRLHS